MRPKHPTLTRSVLPLTRPHPPSTTDKPKRARSSRRTKLSLITFVSLISLFVLARYYISPMVLKHPILRAEKVTRTLPVGGNWRRLRGLIPRHVLILEVPVMSTVSSSSSEGATMLALEPTDEHAEVELFLAPDALEQEPGMTLQELRKWTKAYILSAEKEQARKEKNEKRKLKVISPGRKKKHSAGRKRVRGLANQD